MANFGYRSIEQCAIVVDDEHIIENRIYVAHLVSGKHHNLVVAHAGGYNLAELALARNVEAVGGLVHKQHASVGGKCEAHKHLFLLTHRQCLEIHIEVVHFKHLEIAHHIIHAETRIECAIHLGIFAKRYRWQLKFLGHDKNIGELLGQTLAHILATEYYRALHRR